MNEIKLWINGHEITAEQGQTVMDAADNAGIEIPRLCYHPFLEPVGSCRLCAVEIQGYRGLPAACATPVENGMKLQTHTPKVLEFRREMLRLILERHPRQCLGCPKNGVCELQNLIAQVGIDFPYQSYVRDEASIKPAGSYFERDYNLCVHCGRCVRICHEVRGSKAIVLREINGISEVSTHFDRPLEEAGCQFCGACLDVCPVGALRERPEPAEEAGRLKIEHVCTPLADIVMGLYGREMPIRSESSLCTLCDAGCGMIFELSDSNHIRGIKPDPAGPVNMGQACVQGRFLLKGYLQNPERLTLPLVFESSAFQETSWDAAIKIIAQRLQSYRPGEVAVISDGRATNEELFLMQKFGRDALKTDAIGCITPKGHMSAAEVLRVNLGLAAGTNSLNDMDLAGCIFAVGFNPPASHPISGALIRMAALSGTKLIVANPYGVSIARYADVHLSYYPGTETALIAGLLRLILAKHKDGKRFFEQCGVETNGLMQDLLPYDPETVARITGTPQETLTEAASILAGAPVIRILYGLGLLESHQAGKAVHALITLSYIKNSLGIPGGGILPLYGDSNLQGAWDMGMVSHLLPGQVENQNAGDVLESLKSGKIKALYLALESLEGSRLNAFKPYLEKLDFVVIQDVVMPPVKADVVLPMAAVLEKGGTITSSQRMVRKVTPVLNPPGEAKSVQWVLTELARRMKAPGFSYEDSDAVFAEIRKNIPVYAGITAERLPVQWPCPDEQHPGTPVLFSGQTPQYIPWLPEIPETAEDIPDTDYPFAVIEKDHLRPFFAGPLLAGEVLSLLNPEAQIEMNPADAFGMGLAPGDSIHVEGRSGNWEGALVMNALLPSGLVAVSQENLGQQAGAPVLNGRVVAARVEKQKLEERSMKCEVKE
ncbi:Molybdopterin oxidoreductase [uncultured Desulfobacterium sp.]|uniref:Molybdopterin oxidoreductase n=1 Tax=uncultured Desulfobacterium sp. TaxID=201089 RepID=A0A445N0T8_9BACT|nr:Molybdopterin oxidoreductase [uncultured Desulfobacterium sp.]